MGAREPRDRYIHPGRAIPVKKLFKLLCREPQPTRTTSREEHHDLNNPSFFIPSILQ